MSHHDTPETAQYDEVEAQGNSSADTLAMFSLVVTIVTMAVFFAGH